MSEADKKKDPERPGRIVGLFQKAADICGLLQKKCSEKAQEFGYSKDVLEDAAKKYAKLPDNPMLYGVEDIIRQQFVFLQAQEKEMHQMLLAGRGNFYH